jgi:hypothetical protein
MSNAGRNKKLASFNCEVQMWEEFIARCQEKGTTATALLTRFIELYTDGDLEHLDAHLGNTLDRRLEQRVRAGVDRYLATHQDNLRSLQNQVAALSQKIAFLEGQLNAYSSRFNTKSTTFKQEREFWFIQDRAKYLGLSISANQRIKIEMFANDAYKERHGKPPSTRLYRGTQAFAYPAADVDILDATIKGVVMRG